MCKKWTRLSKIPNFFFANQDCPTWNMHQKEVVDYIRQNLGLGDRFSADFIHHCIGIGTVNAVQASEENVNLNLVENKTISVWLWQNFNMTSVLADYKILNFLNLISNLRLKNNH